MSHLRLVWSQPTIPPLPGYVSLPNCVTLQHLLAAADACHPEALFSYSRRHHAFRTTDPEATAFILGHAYAHADAPVEDLPALAEFYYHVFSGGVSTDRYVSLVEVINLLDPAFPTTQCPLTEAAFLESLA